ncbi:MAG: hypothetical protein QOE01_2852 [Actinomycetota bacterium]|nr:hypothetical protein [Actinomycetota bacterium]
MQFTRRGRLIATLSAGVVALLLVGYVVRFTPVGALLGIPGSRPCHVTVSGHSKSWSRQQAMTATTVAGVGVRIGATVNGVAAAVARAGSGTGDAGITPAAAREIYHRLPDRAHPSADQVALARALMGLDGRALACVVPWRQGHLGREQMGPIGLTPRAESVRSAMLAVFGSQPIGGYAPGGVRSGHMPGSAHYEGRAIDVFFRPIDTKHRAAGWVTAQFLVAHAADLHVATVIFNARIWSAQRSAEGWRPYVLPPDERDNAVLMHRDHVHVDVIRGG